MAHAPITLPVVPFPAEKPPHPEMVWVPGGTFLMGSNTHYPEEAPAHTVTVDGFWMDRYTVTTAQFRAFVEATNYLTFAERTPNAEDYKNADPALLVPASIVFSKPTRRFDLRNPYTWWRYVPGANWHHPEGSASSIDGREQHPVVHIAYEDALAYAHWAGKDLPSEAEWEFAAWGGLAGTEYAWGDTFMPGGQAMANTWHGEFPIENSLADGFEGIAPVGSFPPNGYGLYDMIGNVWEWTVDWYGDHSQSTKTCCSIRNPRGVTKEQSYDPQMPEVHIPRKVAKGGSYLCAPNYCRRYRPAARIPQTLDNSTCHLGFRCILRTKHLSGFQRSPGESAG